MSRKSERIRKTGGKIFLEIKYRVLLEGVLVGILTGLLVSAFRISLAKVEEMRETLLEGASKNFTVAIWGMLILIVFSVGVAFLVSREPLSSGSGIPQVKGEFSGRIKANWAAVIIAKFFGGIMAIGGGLSLGREGPSIQLGAMVGKGFSRLSGRLRSEERMLMTCGAGAGLAAAFGAPLAGVVFTLEEIHKNFSSHILISTMAAAVTGDWVASYIFGLRPVFNLRLTNGLPLSHYWMVIGLGIFLGILGVTYNRLIAIFQNLSDYIKGVFKVVVPLVVLISVAAFYPLALGGGHNLIETLQGGSMGVKALIVLLIVKLLFATFCFSTKAPGGIFLPLLVLGAVSGGLFTTVISGAVGYSEIYLIYFIVLGMAGIFSSIVRAPVTGIILISEMTGIVSNLLPLSIVSLVAYVTAAILGGKPIYDQLLKRMLKAEEEKKDYVRKVE